MADRKYEQRLRAESAEQTRRRILDAVYQQIRDAPSEPVSLDRIAHAAKVARSTIYLVFGSRAGLFDAFAEDLWERTGLPALTAAVANPDARQHLRGGIRAASEMFAADRDIYRAIHSMAQLDSESVGGAANKMDKERAGGMAYLARRLDEDGVLREDLSVEDATNILWMVCSFESFDLLYSGRQLSLDDTIEILITTAERTLYR